MVTDSSYDKTQLKSIRFQKGSLISVLQVVNLEKSKFSGYFQISFDIPQESSISSSIEWYLFFSKGKIVFASCKELNFVNILAVLQNYLPVFRVDNLKAKPKIHEMIFVAKERNDISILRLLNELTLKTKITEYQEITKAIKKHILNELDTYLFDYSGNIKVISDKNVNFYRPIVGFELENIILIAEQRKSQWENVLKIIPSMEYFVQCNTQNDQWKNLPAIQKNKIKNLVDFEQTLEKISYNLGEDRLKIAQTFAKLISKNLVTIDSSLKKTTVKKEIPISLDNKNKPEQDCDPLAEIVIIDDSPVLLKQFKNIVTNWGYRVRCCNDALMAVDFLLKSPPTMIFLDVNMPNLSGFQLMKKIRMQHQLSSIPLVILTAEKTIMNRQRAKWAKSVFLTKPLNSEEIDRFKSDLKNLLQTMVATNSF